MAIPSVRTIPPWLSSSILAGLVFIAYWFMLNPPDSSKRRYEIPYSEFKQYLQRGQVASLELRGYEIYGSLSEALSIGPGDKTSQYFRSTIPAMGDVSLLPLLEQEAVVVKVIPSERTGGWWSLLVAILPWLLFFGVFYWILQRNSRRLGGGMGGDGELQKFLKGVNKPAEVPDVDFGAVAGQENAKREVSELIEFLRNPELYQRLGAELPRGILLMGPPGTGKTLLARALAGEAGVPFYSISGSEFIEVFVGVGASRVRHLFEAAKKNAPSIIFIDELDSIGRTRGTGLGGGHDEREQTLNQILAEMDGFGGHEAVVVLAATNRPDVLDPALLRPGRFDRHVSLDLPDQSDRIAILTVHSKQIPLSEDVEIHVIAAGTPGFSGADLKNLVNEAAVQAAREHKSVVDMSDFEEARDKLLLGTVRTLAIRPEEHHRLAVHEAGHTLAAHFLPHADPLYKVTIIPRGRALGGTHQLPEEERHTLPEEYLQDRLAVLLAGRCAEQELLGSVSSGADDDIRQATSLARAMVGRWGMSEEIGPVDLRDSEEHPFLGREMAQPRRHSEDSAQRLDKAVHQLLLQAEGRAVGVIHKQREVLLNLITELEQKETLHNDEIAAVLSPAQPFTEAK
ncbi:MAG: ATP-dependent zinc metalloprotease FtsH [Gammaproteobacteria bacterium]|nr:ATP-dependent zinc metalloprotease FtsH [Gammaproteobacteria bacterium]